MIKLTNVSKNYGDKIVVDGINLEFPATGLVFLKGENGSGKTTLVNLIGALDIPTEGTIQIGELTLSKSPEKKLCKYREENVGFIFQDYNLFENMTVEDNLKIIKDDDSIKKLADFLKISDLLKEKAKNLSGGEKQRVAIARAILKDPKIIIADEPTASIDYESKRVIMAFLKKLSHEKLIILITHDLSVVPEADIEIVISNGKISQYHERSVPQKANSSHQYKSKFAPFKFAFKNFFTNKKKLILSSVLLSISILCAMTGLIFLSTSINDIAYHTAIREKDRTIFFANGSSQGPLLDDDIDSLYQDDKLKDSLYTGSMLLDDGKQLKFISANANPMGYNMYFEPYYDYTPTVFDIEALDGVDYGRFPTNADEIAISSYLAERFVEFGVIDFDGQSYKPQSLEKLLAEKRKILLGTKGVEVVGIFDLNLYDFENLKNSSEYTVQKTLFGNIISGRAKYIYVKKEFFELYSDALPTLKTNTMVLPKKDGELKDLISGIKLSRDETIVSKGEIVVNSKLLRQYDISEDEAIGTNIILYFVDQTRNRPTEEVSLKIKAISEDKSIYINVSSLAESLDKTLIPAVVLLKNEDPSIIKGVFDTFKLKEAPVTVNTTHSRILIDYESIFTLTSILFIIPAIIFAIISTIYLKNYLLNSIDFHRREIALLKSLGIHDGKIMATFFVEIISLGSFAFLMAISMSVVVNMIVTRILSRYLYFEVVLLSFAVSKILSIYVAVLFLSLILVILAKKKIKDASPIELLKDLNV